MGDYQNEKASARQICIEIQSWLSENSVSWGELADIQDYLERIGRRYGLIRELKENGLL